ncbi:Retrovirus-related Pol polyprotein from transposon TNT 1-94 [Vitis vinifera]|uniref:Retrovirus-related Pol polyprotein from transposon TNT 1-94 n=1 Tax=Vitis vinifera TaxID=29760 RepID=A0A438FC64_VITVI|nr:Retrovirus-related Pol polyprotein from transposon TNT 1-94 [Vitis vinifera]
MKDMGEASYVIGIKIHRDRFQGILGLSQETYINKVLERFRMKNCSPSVSPIVKGDRFNLNQCPKNDLEREQMKNIPYASAVGSLMYRPLESCKESDEISSRNQRLQDYVQRTSNLEVVGYSDSDFAGCVDSRKSTSRYIFILADGAISWRSVKQTMTTTSTMEAEFISCFEAISHGVWLKSFISRLRVMDSISRSLSIYCDNLAAVFMAKNNKSGSRSKHIDIKYLAIRGRVKEKKVVIEHISTELMIADPLTKGMPPLKFKDHDIKLKMWTKWENVITPCRLHVHHHEGVILKWSHHVLHHDRTFFAALKEGVANMQRRASKHKTPSDFGGCGEEISMALALVGGAALGAAFQGLLTTVIKVDVHAQVNRDIKEILAILKSNGCNWNYRGVSDEHENLGSCNAPGPPEFMVGLDVPLKELKRRLCENGESRIVIRAPGGCGKTTLAKGLCHDDQVKEFGCDLELLNDDDAMALFLVTQQSPKIEASADSEALQETSTGPGSVGRSLHGQPVEIWRSRLMKLSEGQSIVDSKTDLRKCLQSSLDALNDEDVMLNECFMDLGSFPEDQKIPATALIDMWAELYKLDEDGNDASEIDGWYSDVVVMQHDLLRDLAIYESKQELIKERKRLFVDFTGSELPSGGLKKSNPDQVLALWTSKTMLPLVI